MSKTTDMFGNKIDPNEVIYEVAWSDHKQLGDVVPEGIVTHIQALPDCQRLTIRPPGIKDEQK
jgi:hypothetical protein